MKATFTQTGNTIDYMNSGASAIDYGSVVILGTLRCGVAASTIDAGEVGALQLCGVFSMPKVTGAVTIGAPLYYLEASDAATTAASQGSGDDLVTNVPIGWAVEAADSAAETVMVKLNN